MADDISTNVVSGNTSPFHFQENDENAQVKLPFGMSTFVALTDDASSQKIYYSAEQAENDLGYNSSIYQQIANYLAQDGAPSAVRLVMFNKNDFKAGTPVTGITLNPTTVTGQVGGSQQITATIEPTGATDKSVTWLSADPSIASVDNTGKITFASAGTTTITATAQGGHKAQVAVTVSSHS